MSEESERLFLYAFQPKSHGPKSYFTIAKSQYEAKKAVLDHIRNKIKNDDDEDRLYDPLSDIFNEPYIITVCDIGGVIENDNS